MSKKKAVYLKIEDWDSLRSAILANVVDCSGSADSLMKIMCELGKHKLDVIEFGAEVITMPFHTGHIIEGRSWLDAIRIPVEVMGQLNLQSDKFKEVQVFLLKPKKPEEVK